MYSDHRGLALIIDDEEELDGTIRDLQEMKATKKDKSRPWPGVLVYTDSRTSDEEARKFHDQVWYMNYVTAVTPPQDGETTPKRPS